MKSFEIPVHYRSPLISHLKENRKSADRMKKDFSPTLFQAGDLEIYLARHFGFCYGVENAIEVSFRAVSENPEKRIFLLSEIIHNPLVNQDLQDQGVKFIMDTAGQQLIPWDTITEEDVIIVPAFGTTVEIEEIIKSKNLKTERYTSTCPFVEKVWNKAEQIGNKGYSVVIHGKAEHEESKATFSHSKEQAPSVIVRNMDEAKQLSQYITAAKSREDFYKEFKGKYSEGFDPERDLQKIGVVNQTTMLATETQEIADYLKSVMIEHYALSEDAVKERFADTRDTLCYATNDNQSAVIELKNTPADFALVVGGYNSSNTSHLFEILEKELPTFYIKNQDKILSRDQVMQWNMHRQELEEVALPDLSQKSPKRILISSGASCPDSVVEAVIERLFSLYNQDAEYQKEKNKLLN